MNTAALSGPGKQLFAFLRTLVQSVPQPRSHTLSLRRPLRRILGMRRFAALMVQTSDQRCLTQNAAALLGISETELALRLARELGLRCLQQVPPFDLELMPAGLTVPELRSAGCTLVAGEGCQPAVVCCNPAAAAGLTPGLRIAALAAWEQIAQALDASEQQYLERREFRRRERLEQLQRAAERVVAHISAEAGGYGGSQLELDFSPEGIFYECPARAGRGMIDERIRSQLLQVLKARAAAASEGQDSPGVLELIPGRRFRLLLKNTPSLPAPDGEPEAAAPPAEQSPKSAPAARKSRRSVKEKGSGKRAPQSGLVLVVDDNPTFVKVIQRFLERQELRVIAAESGARAVELLSGRGERPDLIVCDVHMPGMSGLDLLDQLRSGRKRKTPVIMLTSDDDLELELRALAAGADAFLTKNQDPRLLSAHIKRLLLQSSTGAAGC